MRKTTKKLIAAAMVLVLATVPLTASASWDRLESGGGTDYTQGDDTTTSNSSSKPANVSSTAYPYKDFKALITQYRATNSDVIGWLKIPNTNINYPIVHNINNNNNYYVHRDWRGTQYNNITYLNYVDTATYLDYRARIGDTWQDGTSRNLVLYGHNWNNLRTPFKIGNYEGYSMFAQLPSYTDINFAKENSHIYFSTGENEGVWRVFAVAYCELSKNFFYNNPNPSTTNGEFQNLVKEWQDRSLFDFGVDINTSDRLLTLSTCTRQYNAGENQRYVVVARLLRDGESENDNVTVTVNSDMKQPKFS